MHAEQLLRRAAKTLSDDAAIATKTLGANRVADKTALLAQFQRYRQLVTFTLVVLYVLAIVVAVATVALALRSGSALPKGLVPYIGGAAFVALLEFARRLTKDWLLMTLPLVVAQHASNAQLESFIENLLLAVTQSEKSGAKTDR